MRASDTEANVIESFYELINEGRPNSCKPPPDILKGTCNPNNLQFYGLYLLIKGYLLLNCRFLEPQVSLKPRAGAQVMSKP